MTNNLGNLGGANKVPRPPAPLPSIPPPPLPPFNPQKLAGRVQSAAQPITPEAKSTTSNVIPTKKPPLPPRNVDPEVKQTLYMMQKTAKEGLNAKEGVMGQKINQVRDSIKDNRRNVTWLTDNKKWAQDEIQKLKTSQKLLKWLPEAANKIIQDTAQEYFSLLHDLENKTPLEKKITPAPNSSSAPNSLMSTINKFAENLFTTTSPTTNEQTIRSIAGKHRELSPDGFAFLERLTSGDLKEDFEKHLKITKQLTPPGTPLAVSLQEAATPKEFVDKWVNDLKTTRQDQLSRLDNGENALPIYDGTFASLSERSQLFNGFVMDLHGDDQIKLPKQTFAILQKFFTDVTECAIPINSQIVSDDFYPPGVREKAKLSSTNTRSEDVAKSSREKGITDGFTQRALSNMQNKSNWEKLEFDNGIFVKGYCAVAFRTPDGEQAASGAVFDLSPLHNLTGGLNDTQVVEIFTLTQKALSSHFNLLNEKPEELKLRADKGEIVYSSIPGIGEVNAVLKDKEKLGMNDEQLAVLRTIVVDFCNKITNATNYALLNLGHDKL
jgi:hypothetical protein